MVLENIVKQNEEMITLDHSHMSNLSPFVFPVLCKTPEIKEFYLSQFSGAGIEIRPMIAGNIQKQPFFLKYVKDQIPLPNTDHVHKSGFYCGNYPELTTMDRDTICSCLMTKFSKH